MKKEITPIAILIGNRFVYKSEKVNVSKKLILESIKNSGSDTIILKNYELCVKNLGTDSHNKNILLISKERNCLNNFCEHIRHTLRQLEHDMCEPLKNISNFLSLIKTASLSGENEQINEYINFATDAIKILNNFSKEIFIKQTLREKTIELKTLINDIVVLDKTQIEKHNVKIIVNDNIPKLMGNYSNLLSLFKNLIENSIKHSNNKEISIIIKTKSIQADFITISFEDNNILSNTDIANISAILQGEIGPKDSKGLIICKNTIKRLNGKLELNKAVNNLSYDITLPLWRNEENENS